MTDNLKHLGLLRMMDVPDSLVDKSRWMTLVEAAETNVMTIAMLRELCVKTNVGRIKPDLVFTETQVSNAHKILGKPWPCKCTETGVFGACI